MGKTRNISEGIEIKVTPKSNRYFDKTQYILIVCLWVESQLTVTGQSFYQVLCSNGEGSHISKQWYKKSETCYVIVMNW